jgi:hypothetical protein
MGLRVCSSPCSGAAKVGSTKSIIGRKQSNANNTLSIDHKCVRIPCTVPHQVTGLARQDVAILLAQVKALREGEMLVFQLDVAIYHLKILYLDSQHP